MNLLLGSFFLLLSHLSPVMIQAEEDDGTTEAPTPFDLYTSGIESGYVQEIPEGSGPQINQDRIVDFDYCYGALQEFDVEGNLRLTEPEFFGFAQDFGKYTECLGPLDELPLELRVVWNQLSCECRARGGASDCCLGPNQHIPITGADLAAPLIVEEQQFLRQVCLRTDQAIITYCGPPPPPIIPPPPPAAVVRGAPSTGLPSAGRNGLIISGAILFLIIICCLRRRWCFFAGGKDDESSSESSSSSEDDESDLGGERRVITEEGEEEEDPPGMARDMDIEEGAAAEPEEDRAQLRAVADEEDGDFGGTGYGRSVQEPEYEEADDGRGTYIEQYELPEEGEDPIALKPIPGKETEEEEEPYDLEHYVPDGGVVEYEREGEWAYDADGGWTPEEKAEQEPSEWDREKYEREQVVEPEPVDNRRQRQLAAYDGGAVFDQLEEEHTETHAAATDDMFDWVVRSTLNTLDQSVDDLKGSDHKDEGDDDKDEP